MGILQYCLNIALLTIQVTCVVALKFHAYIKAKPTIWVNL